MAAGKILWQPQLPRYGSRRLFLPITATPGVVYLGVTDDLSNRPDTFMAVATQTGKVLAENPPPAPWAVPDGTDGRPTCLVTRSQTP
ncbi:hypothetical protein ABZ897_42120 [Nonomuraea sp. NPDC046802]|uniref:hypothetical protein n=1 Tax=Nonomuraea sp. NPDC046802 TaxID=3154919 RepID=UPI003401DFA0